MTRAMRSCCGNVCQRAAQGVCASWSQAGGSDGSLRRGVRRAYLGLLRELQCPGHYEVYVWFVLCWGEKRCVWCRVVMSLVRYGCTAAT